MIRRAWYMLLGALAVWLWQRTRSPWTVDARVRFSAALLPPGVAAIGVQVGVVTTDEAGDDDEDDELPGLDPGIWGQS